MLLAAVNVMLELVLVVESPALMLLPIMLMFEPALINSGEI